mgnify:CR=1 FL=1
MVCSYNHVQVLDFTNRRNFEWISLTFQTMSPGNRFNSSSALGCGQMFIHGGETRLGPCSDTWRLDPPTTANSGWEWTELDYKGTQLPQDRDYSAIVFD